MRITSSATLRLINPRSAVRYATTRAFLSFSIFSITASLSALPTACHRLRHLEVYRPGASSIGNELERVSAIGWELSGNKLLEGDCPTGCRELHRHLAARNDQLMSGRPDSLLEP